MLLFFLFLFRRGTGKNKCSCCWYICLEPFFVVVVFLGEVLASTNGEGGGGVYLKLQLLLVELPSAVFVLFLRRGTGKDKWCVGVGVGGLCLRLQLLVDLPSASPPTPIFFRRGTDKDKWGVGGTILNTAALVGRFT